MLLSTQTHILSARLGFREAVRVLCDAGYDALDLSLFNLNHDDSPFLAPDWKDFVAGLKAEAHAKNKTFNQAHAPFPSSKLEPGFNEKAFDRIVRAIEIAGMVGARCIVVHPMQQVPFILHEAELKAQNMDFYRSLAPYAKAAGVKIALENMWQSNAESKVKTVSCCSRTSDFVDWFDTLGDDCFTCCLDLGHCGLYGYSAADMIRGLGHDRLGALHVQDNDFREDGHTLPYFGKMNWNAICEALSDIGYTGDFTFEADEFFKRFPDPLLPDAAAFMVKVGRYLVSQIESR